MLCNVQTRVGRVQQFGSTAFAELGRADADCDPVCAATQPERFAPRPYTFAKFHGPRMVDFGKNRQKFITPATTGQFG